MKRKGKWIAGAVLLLAMAAVVLLYQRDRSARYPLDFTRDELASATVGANYTETLTLTEPEELDALYEALERMRVVGEAERDEGALMGAQAYILKIELKDGGGRTFSYEQRDARRLRRPLPRRTPGLSGPPSGYARALAVHHRRIPRARLSPLSDIMKAPAPVRGGRFRCRLSQNFLSMAVSQ